MPPQATDHDHGVHAPSPWVVRFAHLIAGPRVLDLACGAGRHARFLAARGHRVLAVDRDRGLLDALAGTPGVETCCADLESGEWPIGDEAFDGIVVTNYLHRPLFPRLLRALRPDGALLYETFASGNEAFGRPSNPAFLLAPDELLDLARPALSVVAFEQGRFDLGARAAVVQRLAAVGRARPWPATVRDGAPQRESG
jgi:SAM-dependent methyltransferase